MMATLLSFITTDVTIDPLKSIRLRAIEEGVLQRTDPEAVCLILNTQEAAFV